MSIQSKRELDVTREKLRGLKQVLAETLAPTENTYARDLTLRSLRGTIKRFKEEIIRFEARTSSATLDQ